MASPTPNKGYTYPAHGGAVNSWDTFLNNDYDLIDLNVGGFYPITCGSSIVGATYNTSGATISASVATITPPSSLQANMYYKFSGAITQNTFFVLPAAGGFYDVYNNTTGNFSLTAITAASSTSGTIVSQGGRTMLVSDGITMLQADTNSIAKLKSWLGSPQGQVAGNVATTNGAVTDPIWDVNNQQLYMCTVSGSSSSATWTPQLARPLPQGYLTLSADPTQVIITTDAVSQTAINYYPLVGSWVPVTANGINFFPYQFTSFTLNLTGSQAANVIYDVFLYWNNGAPLIGTGPAWNVSTPGSGARGSGAGTTQLTRLQGIYVNNNAINITNGGAPTAVGINQGIYLGSIFIDGSAGQVTCHRTYGQNRKWGVWNYYNRQMIYLKAGDPNATWNYGTNTVRAANNAPPAWSANIANVGSGTACNSVTVLEGIAEDPVTIRDIRQLTNFQNGTPYFTTGIGLNSVTAFTGTVAQFYASGGGVAAFTLFPAESQYIVAPFLGLNNFFSLEQANASISTPTRGTETNMALSANCRA